MHCHHNCTHEKVKYCKDCKEVYCDGCKQVWTEQCKMPHYSYWDGTLMRLNNYVISCQTGHMNND